MSYSFSISVPIGAYHPLLRDCLHSLAIQTPQPLVALLDASGDDRVKTIAEEFGDLIVYRRHGPDGGQSDAIVEGWANTSGDILGWLNADDALYPGALETAAQKFSEDAETDVVYGHSVIINDDNDITGYHWAVGPMSDSLLTGDIISQPSCFFTRDLYERVGGLDKNLHYTMDWDLWVRFWRAGAKFQFISQTMSRVLWTREAKTGGFGAARRRELNRIINQYGSPVRRLKSKLGFALHHFFEYMMPDSIARTLRRRLSTSGAVINGVGRNGEIASTATLPIVHYGSTSIQSIEFEFAKADAITIMAGVATAGKTATNTQCHLKLNTPLSQGETLLLSFKNEGPKSALLYKVRLG